MSSSPITSQLTDWLAALVAQAEQARQRRLLVVRGELEWQLHLLTLLPSRLTAGQGMLIGPQIQSLGNLTVSGTLEQLEFRQVPTILGREYDWLVIDGRQQLDPDALGIAAGTIKAGGLLILFTSQAVTESSAFDRWMSQQMQQPQVLFVQQHQPLPNLNSDPSAAEEPAQFEDQDCLSADQAQAVVLIHKVADGHRKRPLVLTADRGRGKSAALGIAAARLLQQRPRQIWVTAPSRAAIEPLFERAQAILGVSLSNDGQLRYEQGRISFIPLDQLLALNYRRSDHHQCDLLLVDEAAAIPAPVLEQLLLRHQRLVFSTTVHGYEGTGRGFLIRFQQALQQHRPGWQAFKMNTPIRWAAGDPLESWLFNSLLLDAEPASSTPESAGLEQAVFQCWSSEQLLAQPQLLRQLFGLLVQAHYRTTPGDLKDLLDRPELRVWLLTAAATTQHPEGVVLGACLVATEGGFDAELAEQIWLGQRRPPGQLLPQVLCAQAGWRSAAQLRYWRVVRIAVPEGLRRQGLAGKMLEQLAMAAGRESVDLLGTSFGATPDLLNFWYQQQFQPLWLGLRSDARSGSVSVVYTRPLSRAGSELQTQMAQRFSQQLPRRLSGHSALSDEELITRLLQQASSTSGALYPPSEQDWLDLQAFASGQRGFEQIEPALYQWGLWVLAQPDSQQRLPAQLRQLLIWRVLQRRDWQLLLPLWGYSGPRQLHRWLRSALQPLIQTAG